MEYLERKIFFYTNENILFIKDSLSNFIKLLPEEFIQISKNTVVNSLSIEKFYAKKNGNFILKITSHENLMISRRYVPNLKKTLKALIN